jgi:hypothetical protein
LRKALGEPEEGDNCKEWISNIPLRGYRFNGTAFREQVGIPADPRLSRVRTGKLALRRAEVDFGALVLDLVAALGARWTSGRIRAQTQAADPLICHADAVRLEQIVGNLLDNAMKFSPAGAAVRGASFL